MSERITAEEYAARTDRLELLEARIEAVRNQILGLSQDMLEVTKQMRAIVAEVEKIQRHGRRLR